MRLRIEKKVFSDHLLDGSLCGACCSTGRVDYDLLQEARCQFETKSQPHNIQEDDGEINNSDSDADMDGLLADFDDSAIIQAMLASRLQSAEAATQRVNHGKSMGYAIHAEESNLHLLQIIELREPLVVHLYDPDDWLSVGIDMSLEVLAAKYVGTKFRRISLAKARLFCDST